MKHYYEIHRALVNGKKTLVDVEKELTKELMGRPEPKISLPKGIISKAFEFLTFPDIQKPTVQTAATSVQRSEASPSSNEVAIAFHVSTSDNEITKTGAEALPDSFISEQI